ncbi:MAG: efflux RND transporter periplasmic adaptor subunit [Candidatus Contendobacter sp.]|jgi:membrane fusion protein (multidrug efflux system)|nr:efflux RND transporter periplasmic adaptor subunit [Candidatus Contendobacter sp.]
MIPYRISQRLLLLIGLATGVILPTPAASPPNTTTAKPVPVQVAAVETATMIETASFIGSLVPWRQVDIVSANMGNVTAIYVTEGQKIAQGDPLFLLDDRVAKSDLQSARAQFQNVERDFKRTQELAQTNIVSKSQMDKATSDYATAQANLNSAQTKLDLLTLRAPFAGVIGILKISIGAFALPGMKKLVSLEDNSRLYVDLRVPQQLLPRLRIGQPFTFTSDALSKQRFKGEIKFIDASVDGKTRAVDIRGMVSNPDGKMVGDLAVRVDLQMAVHENAVVAPAAALIPTLEGNDIYRVVEGRVHRIAVKVGALLDGRAEILQGVQPGDQVVTVGQFALEDGMAVSITNGPG